MTSPHPRYEPIDAEYLARIETALGGDHVETVAALGETALHVRVAGLVAVMTTLRDRFDYQQLMEIAGVDWPDRPQRFELVYCLLSLTRNHRLRVHIVTDEATPVPSLTDMWPVAGWLEREVFDLYGVLFDGNPDLRRILTDYGFRGHPLRKDFPMTGYVELRYSEEAKRVVYEPVRLAQDFRTFDFMSPWEGAEYMLPGDEKAAAPAPQAPGAATPLPADPPKVAAPKSDAPKSDAPKSEEVKK